MTQNLAPPDELWAAFLALLAPDSDLAKLFNTLEPAAAAIKKLIADHGLDVAVGTVAGLGSADPLPAMNRLRAAMTDEQWTEFCRRLVGNATAKQIRRLELENDGWEVFWKLALAALSLLA